MDQPLPETPRPRPLAERLLEGVLFNARWLMAPFYLGLVLALVALLVVFVRELLEAAGHLLAMTGEDAILLGLSLIDLSLAGNLILIVIFSGYENFVSKLDTGDHEDRPDWLGKVDFSGLKMKLIASIVAISAIALLKLFMRLNEAEAVDPAKLGWMVAIHLVFVITGVLLALMDGLNARADRH
jgi:uncharacterized protein (TIGR00645 family)